MKTDDHLKNIPAVMRMVCAEPVQFAKHPDKAEGNADGDTRPTFVMLAYTGGKLNVDNFPFPVIIDLDGLNIKSQTRPIRFQHSPLSGVGHTTKIEIKGPKLFAEGIISRATPEAHEIIESASRGFPWQASVGVTPVEIEFIDEGAKDKVNGKNQKGPAYVLRKSNLGEISFVDLGADDHTRVVVTASSEQETMMADEKKGTTSPGTEVSEQVKAGAETAPAKTTEPVQAAAPAPAPKVDPTPEAPEVTAAATAQAVLAEGRKAHAGEVRRLAKIEKLCENDAEVHAEAIEAGWTPDQTELAIMRKGRPTVTSATSTPADAGDTGKILEAAAMVAGGHPDVEKMYDDQTLQVAHDRFRQGVSLQEMLMEAAAANGWCGRRFEALEVMKYAFGHGVQASAFSSVDIGGILSNIANKFLLSGFDSVEQVWRQVASRRSVKDFKTVTSYRLIGNEQYELVAPGGEIQHGDLGEQSFTNKADTYGLMLNVSRTDIINDDLGAITMIPRKLGRGSGLKINDVFWTAFMANTNHFTTGNNNFLDGSTSNLGIDSLSTAEQTFMDQVDTEGKPLGLMPQILLAPTSLSAISAQLFRSLEIRDTTASTKIPVGNPHQGKYTPLISRYLGNSTFTGNSQLAWYLLGNPEDLSTIEIAFLNGQEAPTIESAEAAFNVLGIQMRGFHDFGVNLQDPKGGVKTLGEA